MHCRTLVLSATTTLLLLAACSSGDDSTATSSTTGAPVTGAPTTSGVSTTTAVEQPGASVAVPTVEGPITGGERNGLPSNPTPPELLQQYGYVEQEFFISGDATAYTADGTLGRDGLWAAHPNGTAPYTTRILVRRPADPATANGIIAVEWFNVSGGQDADPDFGSLYPTLLSEGTTWVGVSAQFGGVQGPGLSLPIPGVSPTPLKAADPTRYAPLSHPGDDYSYDIYSQAAQAIRRPQGADPLGGVHVTKVIAIGESQAAGRLTIYINAVHPLARIYDGFLVHSRIIGAPLADGVEMPAIVNFRTDLAEPILWFQTETDVAHGSSNRQPDTDRLVTWEVAGAAHADQSQLDWGGASAHVLDPDFPLPAFESMCGGTLNQGPQPLVIQRAWSDLETWVVDGTRPATAPPLELNDDGSIRRDELGIAVGGIRTPDVDVPIAVHSGVPRPDVSVLCMLFGSTSPLGNATLASLYPSHDDYVARVRASAEAAMQAGYLLQAGVDEFVAEAQAAPVPG